MSTSRRTLYSSRKFTDCVLQVHKNGLIVTIAAHKFILATCEYFEGQFNFKERTGDDPSVINISLDENAVAQPWMDIRSLEAFIDVLYLSHTCFRGIHESKARGDDWQAMVYDETWAAVGKDVDVIIKVREWANYFVSDPLVEFVDATIQCREWSDTELEDLYRVIRGKNIILQAQYRVRIGIAAKKDLETPGWLFDPDLFFHCVEQITPSTGPGFENVVDDSVLVSAFPPVANEHRAAVRTSTVHFFDEPQTYTEYAVAGKVDGLVEKLARRKRNMIIAERKKFKVVLGITKTAQDFLVPTNLAPETIEFSLDVTEISVRKDRLVLQVFLDVGNTPPKDDEDGGGPVLVRNKALLKRSAGQIYQGPYCSFVELGIVQDGQLVAYIVNIDSDDGSDTWAFSRRSNVARSTSRDTKGYTTDRIGALLEFEYCDTETLADPCYFFRAGVVERPKNLRYDPSQRMPAEKMQRMWESRKSAG